MSGKIEISRDLAERLLNFTCNEEYDELRALLEKSDDADKVSNRQMGLMQFVDKHAAPVVERQPVAWMWTHERGLRLSTTKENSPFYEGKGEFTKTPLYDEQPAPVAVALTMKDVMSAMQQARGFPMLTSNHCHTLAEALNKICLDKVKELNQ